MHRKQHVSDVYQPSQTMQSVLPSAALGTVGSRERRHRARRHRHALWPTDCRARPWPANGPAVPIETLGRRRAATVAHCGKGAQQPGKFTWHVHATKSMESACPNIKWATFKILSATRRPFSMSKEYNSFRDKSLLLESKALLLLQYKGIS